MSQNNKRYPELSEQAGFENDAQRRLHKARFFASQSAWDEAYHYYRPLSSELDALDVARIELEAEIFQVIMHRAEMKKISGEVEPTVVIDALSSQILEICQDEHLTRLLTGGFDVNEGYELLGDLETRDLFLPFTALFQDAPLEAKMELARHLEPVELSTAEVLPMYQEGEPVLWLIDSGDVQILQQDPEHRADVVLGTLSKGGFFGALPLLGFREESIFARTLEPVKAYRLSGEQLSRLMRTYPELSWVMKRSFSHRFMLHAIGATPAGWALNFEKRQALFAEMREFEYAAGDSVMSDLPTGPRVLFVVGGTLDVRTLDGVYQVRSGGHIIVDPSHVEGVSYPLNITAQTACRVVALLPEALSELKAKNMCFWESSTTADDSNIVTLGGWT